MKIACQKATIEAYTPRRLGLKWRCSAPPGPGDGVRISSDGPFRSHPILDARIFLIRLPLFLEWVRRKGKCSRPFAG